MRKRKINDSRNISSVIFISIWRTDYTADTVDYVQAV